MNNNVPILKSNSYKITIKSCSSSKYAIDSHLEIFWKPSLKRLAKVLIFTPRSVYGISNLYGCSWVFLDCVTIWKRSDRITAQLFSTKKAEKQDFNRSIDVITLTEGPTDRPTNYFYEFSRRNFQFSFLKPPKNAVRCEKNGYVCVCACVRLNNLRKWRFLTVMPAVLRDTSFLLLVVVLAMIRIHFLGLRRYQSYLG